MSLLLGATILSPEQLTDGTVVRISSDGSKQTYRPTVKTAAGRGTALAGAMAAAVNGDKLFLGPHVYEPAAALSVTRDNWAIVGNGAVIRRPAARQDEYVLRVGGEKVTVANLEIDGNAANAPLTTGRGEGLRTDGADIYVVNVYSHDAPAKSGDKNTAAACFYSINESAFYHGCVADNPGWACYRMRCPTWQLFDSHALVSSYRADTKARFLDTDGADMYDCGWYGGRWWTDQAYEIQAVMDPGDGYSGRSITLQGLLIDCGALHDDATGDSFLKFDEWSEVVLRDVVQRHSGLTESFCNIERGVRRIVMDNVLSDGAPRFASGATENDTELAIFRNSVFGYSQSIKHALDNCNQCATIISDGTQWKNIVGGGNQASGLLCAFQNGSSSSGGQRIRLINTHIDTNWAEIGSLYRHVREIGHVAHQGVTRNNQNAGIILAPTWQQRIMAAVMCGDEMTAHLGWTPLAASQVASIVSSPTTWLHEVREPVDPSDPAGDWYDNGAGGSHIAGPQGARILNRNYGNGGNTHPRVLTKTAGGNFVDD